MLKRVLNRQRFQPGRYFFQPVHKNGKRIYNKDMKKPARAGGEPTYVEHPFPPVYDKDAKVLILGSLPSVKSREQRFYYGHPQNRFWKVLAAILEVPVPQTIEQKKDMLLAGHIAIWDVIQSCTIIGSSDASIKDAVPVDLTALLREAPIQAIFCNGQTAFRYYKKFLEPLTGIQAKVLPSSSPANAAWKLPALTEAWKQAILPFLKP